jgi:hypothetical protein
LLRCVPDQPEHYGASLLAQLLEDQLNAPEKLSVDAAEAREALNPRGRPLAKARHGALVIELHRHRSDLWLTFARDASGGVALRMPFFLEDSTVTVARDDGSLLGVEINNDLGQFRARLRSEDAQLEQFNWRVDFTPRQDAHLPYFPRDLVPFGKNGDPLASEGVVEASQRRLNTGLCYLRFEEPALGKLLYVQNLTSLNDYYRATQTKPESSVGGEWPILGYLPPTQPANQAAALPAGKKVTLYDTRLVFRDNPEDGEAESTWQFLDMLGAVYQSLDKPKTEWRDWVGRSERTLHDLATSPKAIEKHYGNVYFHPYTNAEHPDSMVQLALLTAIQDWGRWSGKRHKLEAQISRGMERFYDPKLKALRRYLPDVGDDKDADAVDSWYLYHPLLNLSSIALRGEEWARDLFLRSIDYGIAAARHFKYKWPIQFKIGDFSIITPVAPADQRGQTDVGGIYAWVMLQAFELTHDARFLDEARAAIDAAKGMRFNLNYQANLTAWGAAACVRLWRITNDKSYLALSYVYLASFFHNSQMWESGIDHAQHYSNFLAVTCLQDAPYMAMYECYDSYVAFEHYLDLAGPDFIPAAKMLITEYCRFALHRAWFYYPDALPEEALATELRNGEIDRDLSFPVEDLYPDGQPAGQVGQEIYGAGAAMVFATRAFHRVEGAPFMIFCDHFLRAFARVDRNMVSFRLDGEEAALAEFRLVRTGRKALPPVTLRTVAGRTLKPKEEAADPLCFQIPGNSVVVLSW